MVDSNLVSALADTNNVIAPIQNIVQEPNTSGTLLNGVISLFNAFTSDFLKIIDMGTYSLIALVLLVILVYYFGIKNYFEGTLGWFISLFISVLAFFLVSPILLPIIRGVMGG